jgi:Tol biopolymer transport system component
VKLIRGGLLSGVGAIVALLALSPTISWATYPGANGRIAYSCSGICTILPDGSGMEKIADLGHSPSWSADGERLVFVRYGQVVTMDADGGNQTQITHGDAAKESAGFSPNGRRIVFEKHLGGYDTPERVSLWRVRTDGTDQQRIVSDYAASPVYSPSGKRQIVFEGSPRGEARNGIWKIRPDGSHLRRLTDPRQYGPYFDDQLLDWSPSGGQILFYRCEWGIHECGGGNRVMRRDGSREHPINHPSGEVYSPDGNRFAFASGDYDNVAHSYNCLDIYTMRLNGSDIRALTHNCEDFNNGGPGGYDSGPSWQPIPPQ